MNRTPSKIFFNIFLLFLLVGLAVLADGSYRLSDFGGSPESRANPSWKALANQIAGVSAPAAWLDTAFQGCSNEIVPAVNEAYEQEIVERINAIRQEHGLPPLKRSDNLAHSARYHAADLANDNYFEHDSFDRIDGGLVKACNWYERISSFYSRWTQLGENLAAGQINPEMVVAAWMGSEGHRSNILSGDYWEIGVGYSEGAGDYKRYWVQDFGRPDGDYPLVIAGEAETTSACDVPVFIYGSWSEVRFRNDSESWSEWMPFQNEMTWSLNNLAGERTVTAEMRSGVSSATSSDGINLEQDSFSILSSLPESLSFVYSKSADVMLPPSVSLAPPADECSGGLDWKAEVDGTWLDAAPLSGTTPDPVILTPVRFRSLSPGKYSAAVNLTTSASSHTIDVILQVTEASYSLVFLPYVR